MFGQSEQKIRSYSLTSHRMSVSEAFILATKLFMKFCRSSAVVFFHFTAGGGPSPDDVMHSWYLGMGNVTHFF